jgi:hypothetical protein
MRAPGSGSRAGLKRLTGSFAACSAGFQDSKSAVAQTFPEAVRMYNWDPSCEYQARSTGPVARPAKPRSIAALPMWRQSGVIGVGAWPITAWLRNAAATTTPPTVALLHMVRVHCILYHRQFDQEIADSMGYYLKKTARSHACMQF